MSQMPQGEQPRGADRITRLLAMALGDDGPEGAQARAKLATMKQLSTAVLAQVGEFFEEEEEEVEAADEDFEDRLGSLKCTVKEAVDFLKENLDGNIPGYTGSDTPDGGLVFVVYWPEGTHPKEAKPLTRALRQDIEDEA